MPQGHPPLPGPLSLTLFVPGLLEPPADAPLADLLQGLALPALERLLARAERVGGPVGDAEAVLFALFGAEVPPGDDPPVAAVTRAAEGGGAPAGWYLRADPVHLRADLSRLILFDAGTFALSMTEAAALAAAVRPLFAEVGGVLEVPAPARWYLRVGEPVRLRTRPLSAACGRDLRQALPLGADERRWRALLTEVQMALFGTPVNAEREARGEPVVNSLWVWGGGELPPPPPPTWAGTWSGDPLAVGLAGLAGTPSGAAPAGLAAWLAGGPEPGAHLVVTDALQRAARYGDVEGWREALAGLEAAWVAPALDAVAAGRVASLGLATGAGSDLRLGRGALRRWWRRQRPLADALGILAGG